MSSYAGVLPHRNTTSENYPNQLNLSKTVKDQNCCFLLVEVENFSLSLEVLSRPLVRSDLSVSTDSPAEVFCCQNCTAAQVPTKPE